MANLKKAGGKQRIDSIPAGFTFGKTVEKQEASDRGDREKDKISKKQQRLGLIFFELLCPGFSSPPWG